MLTKNQTGSKCTLGEYELYEYINVTTKLFGGISVNDKYEKPVEGYMVAVKNFDTLEEMLSEELRSDEYYGTWLDENTGITYYDISRNFLNKEMAILFAKLRRELAIYDITNNQSIYL